MVFLTIIGSNNDEPPASPTSSIPTAAPTETSISPQMQTSESIRPSSQPPTKPPTIVPSNISTTIPTKLPTTVPSNIPSEEPTINPTSLPSSKPSASPSLLPTDIPTSSPTSHSSQPPSASPTESFSPSTTPSTIPSSLPTLSPSSNPSTKPTIAPSHLPSISPSMTWTTRPSRRPTHPPKPTPPPTADITKLIVYHGNVTYQPGNLTHRQAGLLLSAGLGAKIIARAGQTVPYKNGQFSEKTFHHRPDAGATFLDTRPWNSGGWIYVSNSEIRYGKNDPVEGYGKGGVGAITFDQNGNAIEYSMNPLNGSTWNCGGGRTPWETWVSCEEHRDGRCWQVDPQGVRPAEKLTVGSETGHFESFTYDIRNMSEPHFYITEDAPRGEIQRFTPDTVDWTKDPWTMLHGPGDIDFLFLERNPTDQVEGTFTWIKNREKARRNAFELYPSVEGIDSDGESIYFVSKKTQQLYELNLVDGTYTNSSTVRGKFDGKPDQVARILHGGDHDDDLLYFTEEGGKDAGVHARNSNGDFVTVFESPVYISECAGLAFSPDAKHMYIAYQDEGILIDVYRKDGLPFHAKSLNIKYHKDERR